MGIVSGTTNVENAIEDTSTPNRGCVNISSVWGGRDASHEEKELTRAAEKRAEIQTVRT